MNLIFRFLDTCVFKAIQESECPTDGDIYDTVLECQSVDLKHDELCWQDENDYPLNDGLIGEDDGTYCSDPGQYMFKCVKGTTNL